jgi:hypothetical protein
MQALVQGIQEIDVASVPIEMRRFSFADIQKHGHWLVPRMTKAFPELTENSAVGWLKGFVVSNEYLFLYQPTAVALFQLMPGYTLVPAKVVQERFVWCENPEDKDQQLAAADFYREAYLWAERLVGIEHVIVDESSDVPKSAIEQTMVNGHKVRILKREMTYVRVKDR